MWIILCLYMRTPCNKFDKMDGLLLKKLKKNKGLNKKQTKKYNKLFKKCIMSKKCKTKNNICKN